MIYNHFNTLVVILIFGSLLLLSFVYFANPLKVNNKGNSYFAFFLLLFASFWLEEITLYSGWGEINKRIITSIRMIQIFAPHLLYMSILYYTNPEFRIGFKQWYHLLLPVIYATTQVLITLDDEWGSKLFMLSVIIILIQALFYTIISYFVIQKHKKRILLFSSNTKGINLNWLEYIIIQIFILCIIIIVHNIFVSTKDLNLFMNAVLLVTIYIIAYLSLQQKEIFPGKSGHKEDLKFVTQEDSVKVKKRLMQEDELEVLKRKLESIMKSSRPYLDSELNLVKLAELISVTPHQLSYIINAGFGENFYQFVNRYRVERAKELLKDTTTNKTMLAVAYDAGFNSKTVFNTTFKKITHQTPSEFKKSVRIHNQEHMCLP